MMEEQIEQTLQREAVGIGAKIIQFALMMLYNISRWALRQNGKILHSMGEGLQKIIYKQLHEGKISEKTLQRDNGNIHQTAPITKQDLKTVEQSLKKSGVKYAAEKLPASTGHETEYIIHFKGEDLAHVEHAIKRAADQLQHDINVLPSQQTEAPAATIEHTTPQTNHETPAPQEAQTTKQPSEAAPPKQQPKMSQQDVLTKLTKKTENLKAQQTVKPQMPVKNHIR